GRSNFVCSGVDTSYLHRDLWSPHLLHRARITSRFRVGFSILLAVFQKGAARAVLSIGTLISLSSTAYAQVTEAGGVSVFEAEDFITNLSARSEHDWTFSNSVSGFSGLGYMEATPNTGANLSAGSSSPELQFTV